jgi:hypothetical protein
VSATDEQCTVITRNEDGDVSVDVMHYAVLEKRLNDNYYGEIMWLNAGASAGDPNYWPSGISGIILNGGPIVPTRVETAVRWRLP